MKRLYKPAVFGCALLWLASTALRADVFVTTAVDLHADGQLAAQQQLPILLAFMADHCEYCELLEEEILRPMLLSGEYRDKIIIRKLVLDNGSRVRDFSGRRVSANRLSGDYAVQVTPTLLFVDASGRELAERMLGINTPEMFGGYLDECIETALQLTSKPGAPLQPSGCALQASGLNPVMP